MHYIASKIVDALAVRDLLRHSSKEIYIYGLDLALYTILSTIGLVLIGFLGSRVIETMILITLFYTNQSLGGGFHASSHLKCFLTMALGSCAFLFTFCLPYNQNLYIILGSLSLFILWLYPLVLHPNKKFLISQSSQFIIRSRRVVLSEALLFLLTIILNWPDHFIQAIACSFSLCSVSRCVAVLQHKALSFH